MSDHYTASAFGPSGWRVYDVSWERGAPRLIPSHGLPGLTLVPGFVDLHIHGAFGIDFMSADASQMSLLCRRLAEIGYEAFLPTTVSASPEAVSEALRALPDSEIVRGFHLEGPFISQEYPGAQPPEAISDFGFRISDWEPILNDRRLRYITLAPERPSAIQLIERLSARGVAVSMGHTAATFGEASAGFEAGARHTTHTFNAMRPFHHREPGIVGFALTCPKIGCELIYDRLHVSKPAAEVLFRCKEPDHVIAVSDGTMASGLGDGKGLKMWSHQVETRNGGVYLAGTNTLAGSAITLLDAFRNLADDFGEEVAARACCLNPRAALTELARPRVYVEFDRKRELVGIRRVGNP